MAWVWGGTVVGTAVAAVADRLVGGLDGRPALYLIVLFGLPFWDRLPARVSARLGTLTALLLGVAALWLAVAAARPEGWWRGEVAFGLACAVVGTAHALAGRRRTVDP